MSRRPPWSSRAPPSPSGPRPGPPRPRRSAAPGQCHPGAAVPARRRRLHRRDRRPQPGRRPGRLRRRGGPGLPGRRRHRAGRRHHRRRRPRLRAARPRSRASPTSSSPTDRGSELVIDQRSGTTPATPGRVARVEQLLGAGTPVLPPGADRGHPDTGRRRHRPASSGSPLPAPPWSSSACSASCSRSRWAAGAVETGSPGHSMNPRCTGDPCRPSEVHPAGVTRARPRPDPAPGWPGPGDVARRQGAAHLLELRPGGHLLGVHRGLDPVEEPLEPADQLGLGDPQLGVGGGRRPR